MWISPHRIHSARGSKPTRGFKGKNMGIYSGTTPCGCEVTATVIDDYDTGWLEDIEITPCEEHKPKTRS